MPHVNRFKWSAVFDYIVFPLLLVWFIYQPDFMHGFIDNFESGKELSCVNELFRGKVLYKESMPYFGPLNVYLQAFSMILFGKSIAVLSGYFYFGTLLTLLLSYFIGRSLCRGRFFPYLLGISLAVETISPFWATRWGGFRFTFGLLTILCAITFFKRRHDLWAFLTGACASIAVLTTIDVGFFSFFSIAAAGFLYAMSNFKKKEKGHSLKSALILASGVLAVFVPFAVYFHLKGALVPYLKTIFTIATLHFKVWGGGGVQVVLSEALNPTGLLSMKFKILAPLFIYIYAAIYLWDRLFAKAISWKECAICCLSVYGAFMYKMSFRAMIGPQFEMALQPAIILGFVFADDIFYKMKASIGLPKARTRTAGSPLKTYGLGLVLVLLCIYAVFSEKVSYKSLKNWCVYQLHKRDVVPIYLQLVPAERLRMIGLTIDRANGVKVPDFQVEEMEGITKYITKMTDPSEAVFTFPDLGLYNFLANRPCLDRFSIAAFAWTSPEWRKELLADLETLKPKYIIRSRKLSNLAAAVGMVEEVLPEVREYIEANYYTEASFNSIDILRRKQ